MVWASSQSQEHLAHQGRGGQPRLPVAWVSLARASLEPHTRLPVEGLARAGMRGYRKPHLKTELGKLLLPLARDAFLSAAAPAATGGLCLSPLLWGPLTSMAS